MTTPTAAIPTAADVLRVADIGLDAPAALLARYGLRLHRVESDAAIPGSFWGEPEAGIIGCDVYVRDDTPVHSLLHEAGHLIVLPAENALRCIPTRPIRWKKKTPPVTCRSCWPSNCLVWAARLMADMDSWGYTYRLGSTRAWFEQDAENARSWLDARGLLPA